MSVRLKRIDHGAPFPLERKRRDMVDLLVLVVGLSAYLAISYVDFHGTILSKHVWSILRFGD